MDPPPAHNIFEIDGIKFSSNFDNGNLAKVEGTTRAFQYKLWVAPDNMGSSYNINRHNAHFHFFVSGVPGGSILRMTIMNVSHHQSLYKFDMRPVYCCKATNNKWIRIRQPVVLEKAGETGCLTIEHYVELDNDKIYFAFTYPYTYDMVQKDLRDSIDNISLNFDSSDAIYCNRECLTMTPDGRRIDLVTITAMNGLNYKEREPLIPGLFPEHESVYTGGQPCLNSEVNKRPFIFSHKETVFISARVHAGEVPAQHTWKGIHDFLLNPYDARAKELRKRYVFKIVPMLNPDGVYRGHFRMDQYHQNLNRHYVNPDPRLQPAIYAVKFLLNLYAERFKLAMYLDLHAHASKRGCFIYGNVMNDLEDQVQNQMFCQLIALNTPHFDYEGCLFSREHMTRIDACDLAKGLTAEGSGRVATFMAYGLIHSYTLECNYNMSKMGNEIVPVSGNLGYDDPTPTASFTANPEKYTPQSFACVGRACMIALLDIRRQNPCSRLINTRVKTLERLRDEILAEVRSRKEYRGHGLTSGNSNTKKDEKDGVSWRRVTSNIPDLSGLAAANKPSSKYRSLSLGGRKSTPPQQREESGKNAADKPRVTMPISLITFRNTAGIAVEHENALENSNPMAENSAKPPLTKALSSARRASPSISVDTDEKLLYMDFMQKRGAEKPKALPSSTRKNRVLVTGISPISFEGSSLDNRRISISPICRTQSDGQTAGNVTSTNMKQSKFVLPQIG